MKQKLSSFYSRLLANCLVLLGFGACITGCRTEYGTPSVEYGVPSARYNVQGKVVSAEGEKAPVKDIRVVMIEDVNEADNPYLRGDTTYTDSAGEFEIRKQDFPHYRFKVKFQDIDGEENGLFDDKEQIIEFKSSDFKGGDGWYKGEAQKDMYNVELKPEKEDK